MLISILLSLSFSRAAVFVLLAAATVCAYPAELLSSEPRRGEGCGNSAHALRGGVTVAYYEIYGSSFEELRLEMNHKGPVDQFGRRQAAYTFWQVSWSWPLKAGEPDFSRTRARRKIKITFPCWQGFNQVEPAIDKKWNEFVQALWIHELGHVSIAYNSAKRISAGIKRAYRRNPNLKILEAHKIAKAVLADIRRRDRAHDVHTDKALYF